MKTHESQGIDEQGVWDWDTGITGLVRHRANGRYYSRFQVNRKRTMKALKTDDLARAKVKHFELLAGAGRQRLTSTTVASGKGAMGDLLTLALATHGENSSLSARTKESFANSVERLKRHWHPCFGRDLSTQKPDKISGDMAEKFANYLHTRAEWRRHRAKGVSRGYGAVTVNVTVECLHLLTRFTNDRLPRSTVRALRAAAGAAFAAVWRLPGFLTPVPTVNPHPRRPSRVRKVRTVISRYSIFVPVGGLGVHRTAAQAHAAGFPDLATYRDALATTPPDRGVLFRQATAVAAERVTRQGTEARREVASVVGAAKRELGKGARLRMTRRGGLDWALAAEVRRDLFATAEAAVGEFIGIRAARFPRLASALVERFGAGCLARSTRRNLRFATRRAIEIRVRQLRRSPAPLIATVASLAAARAEARRDPRGAGDRIDAMLTLVRERGTRDPYSARCARKHAELLGQWRETIRAA